MLKLPGLTVTHKGSRLLFFRRCRPAQNLRFHFFQRSKSRRLIAAQRLHGGARATTTAKSARILRHIATLLKYLQQIRVGQQWPRNGNQVAFAFAQRSVDKIALLKTAIGDDGNFDGLFELLGKTGVDAGLEFPAHAENRARHEQRQEIKNGRAQIGFEAQMPRRICKQLEAVDRVSAGIAFGIGKAEAAVNVQIIDAQFFQIFAVLQRLGQIIADEIMPQRKDERPSDIEGKIVEILGG